MSVLARLWALRRDRPRFVALGVLTLGSLLAWPAVDWWLRGADIAPPFMFWDFGAYGTAVDNWLYGDPIYEQTESGGYFGSFLYPPFTVAVFRQFFLLKFRQAAIAFEALSLGLLWVGLQLVVRSLGVRLRWWERGGLLWVAVGFQPLFLSLKMGQTPAFLTAMLCFAFAAMEGGYRGDDRRLQFLSGVATGVVGVVKLAYAPVGAHLLRNRDRFAGAVAAGVGLLAFSLAVFGVETHLTYIEVLLWGVESGEGARSPTLWGAPYFRPLGWLGPSVAARVVLSAIIAGYAVLAGPELDREVFALGVAAFPLLAPLAYTYYLTALLPAAAILVAVELERDGYPAVPLAGFLLAHLHAYGLRWLVVELPKTYPGMLDHQAQFWFLQPGLWGVTLLSGIAFYRVAESVSLRRRLAALRDRLAAGRQNA